jgi:methionyl aminopeptidase
MDIPIKSKKEQDVMCQGGKILASILDRLKAKAQPGITKKEIDALARDLCSKNKVKPSFLGYNGYPDAVCVSVNNEVVHGAANNHKLKKGDLASLDMGVLYKEFHVDAAISFLCGNESDSDAEKLIKVCEQSFYSGIKLIKDGVHLGDISAKIQETAEREGYGVVRMLVGHGIGKNVHELPPIPNYGEAGKGPILKTGMTLAIEPMIIEDGSYDVILSDDKWTYETKTGARAAHYEHTVLVTDNGYEILTK